MRSVTALMLAMVTCSTVVGAAEINEKAVAYKLPDQIPWKSPVGAGPHQAVMHGDPTKPGPYIVLVKWPPNSFSRPHFHPNDRFITVVKGSWWVGTGNKFDTANTVPMPAGSFVTHFAKEVHWDGAKDEETIIMITGEGPATTTRVEEAK